MEKVMRSPKKPKTSKPALEGSSFQMHDIEAPSSAIKQLLNSPTTPPKADSTELKLKLNIPPPPPSSIQSQAEAKRSKAKREKHVPAPPPPPLSPPLPILDLSPEVADERAGSELKLKLMLSSPVKDKVTPVQSSSHPPPARGLLSMMAGHTPQVSEMCKPTTTSSRLVQHDGCTYTTG